MSTAVSDALHNPTDALAQLYEHNTSQGIDSFPAIVTAHFSSIFKPGDALQKIPVLDLYHPPESFPDRSLVVFDAMVQDTSLSPELYLAKRHNNTCGGWGLVDEIVSGDDVQYDNLRECSTFWAISIPGASAWCYGQNQASPSSFPHASVQKHKYPIPDAPHVGVQIKVYDDNLAKPLRTTDMVSFIGILTFEPLHTGVELASPENVPTLHTFFCTPIPRTIVPRSFPETSLPFAAGFRKEVIQWIADEGLGGDYVAAEWVFLCALARVRSRHPPVLPLSLTIANFPAPPENLETKPALYYVLSQIFPLVSLLPLTLSDLNNTPFCPESKDDNLHSGQLQLPKGTVLVLSEGAITEGGIFNKGVMNIRAIQDMMSEQTLQYVFPFSNFQFQTEVNFLVMTESKRSTFFKTDVTVPLRPNVSKELKQYLYKSAENVKLPSAQKLTLFRELVGGSMVGNVAVAETLDKHVEDDYVKERSTKDTDRPKPDGATFTPDDLILRMMIARLIALSLHQTEVTIDNWESAKELEGHTKGRV